ncbi:short chain dehydrogenase family protein [Paraburkholderia xenovorans LB400]|uniref:Short-chain dehydrogenase n=1 Tax=Paraburkholderia xenovorans (strain LB400) TaxID=266265 RepID=Q13IN9_PARXL|nr:SDR family NAD(P)-dependent oxidoreductase [Paraburkholderia xenovorans]ABE36050.1 Putative short-chain dehydrogenase [Paraburkholderia xenovorans LB400]AIP34099.1 short chain dehydrogenase family protein [Paraburkholderia xenovorans LB400]
MTEPLERQNDHPRLAWIAGVGASAGLGAALARRFAREGLTVVVTGRSHERLDARVAEIRGAGGHALALPGDVTSESDLAAITRQLADAGTLEVAIFNAAGATRAPTLELTAEQFEAAWRVTTLGGFLFARAALQPLLARGHGSLLFTGATASLRGRPPFAAFASAKAGLRSLAQSLAREFGPRNIHVAHVVIDGGIDGERLRTSAPQRVSERGPDGLLDPADIADAYWYLHRQSRSAWSQEIDLRPFNESF